MRLPGPLVAARFIRRDNRFRVTVRLQDGVEVAAHLANPGRMHEILIPGASPLLAHRPTPGSVTAYDVALLGVAKKRPRRLRRIGQHCALGSLVRRGQAVEADMLSVLSEALAGVPVGVDPRGPELQHGFGAGP